MGRGCLQTVIFSLAMHHSVFRSTRSTCADVRIGRASRHLKKRYSPAMTQKMKNRRNGSTYFSIAFFKSFTKRSATLR